MNQKLGSNDGTDKMPSESCIYGDSEEYLYESQEPLRRQQFAIEWNEFNFVKRVKTFLFLFLLDTMVALVVLEPAVYGCEENNNLIGCRLGRIKM